MILQKQMKEKDNKDR